MDRVSVKVEEENEQKPIPFPDVARGQVSGLNPEQVFEIKVELEEENIKTEEEDLDVGDSPMPRITAVSGAGGQRGVFSQLPGAKWAEPRAGRAGPKYSERPKATESTGPTSRSVKVSQIQANVPPQKGLLPQISVISGAVVELSHAPLPAGPGQTNLRCVEDLKARENPSGAPSSADAALEDSYDCVYCEERFPRKPRLGKHVLQTHLDRLLLRCPQCEHRFCSKRALASHRMFHTGKKLFCCGRCGAAFKYHSNFLSHLHDHLGCHPYECDQCGAGFLTRGRAAHHMDTHHSRFWPFKCHTCLAPFLEKKNYRRHMKKKHGVVLRSAAAELCTF